MLSTPCQVIIMLIQHSEFSWRPLTVMVAKFMANVRPDDSLFPQLMYKLAVNIDPKDQFRHVSEELSVFP